MIRRNSTAAHARPLGLLCYVTCLVVACHVAACNGGSSGGSGVLAPGLTNTGVAASTVLGTGDLELLIAVEPFEHKDPNGDGDADDAVLYVIP